jgi:putative acetyltransferase
MRSSAARDPSWYGLRSARYGRAPTERSNNVIEIRDEQPSDVAVVREVNRQAFGQELEGRIVDALRASGGVQLSLVADVGHTVVGHILFSPVNVNAVVGAALGPMAVVPEYQRQGVGSLLVARGLERLRAEGCPFVVVLGHPTFYPRFGFHPAGPYGVHCEWDVPAAAFMVAVLDPSVAGRLKGVARYRSEFAMVE